MLTPEGLEGVTVATFDGPVVRDITPLMRRALEFTRDLMKRHDLMDDSPWVSDDDGEWEAPSENTAAVIAGQINEFDGHAKCVGRTVNAKVGEIWSVVTWYMFARTARIFHIYPKKDPILHDLSGGAPSGQVFSGLTVCFTGKLGSMERTEAHALVQDLGGQIATGITANVNLVVAAEKAGSKLGKAKARGIRVIDEAEFKRTAGI
jgi:NAD-dependent DNA ligase